MRTSAHSSAHENGEECCRETIDDDRRRKRETKTMTMHTRGIDRNMRALHSTIFVVWIQTNRTRRHRRRSWGRRKTKRYLFDVVLFSSHSLLGLPHSFISIRISASKHTHTRVQLQASARVNEHSTLETRRWKRHTKNNRQHKRRRKQNRKSTCFDVFVCPPIVEFSTVERLKLVRVLFVNVVKHVFHLHTRDVHVC